MTIIESTLAFLFRSRAPVSTEKHEQQTRRILRNITDPAESVGECLKPNEKDHDATEQKAKRFQ